MVGMSCRVMSIRIFAEDNPLPRVWLQALMREAAAQNVKLDWVNCGLCVDERGAAEAIEGVRRGSPLEVRGELRQHAGHRYEIGSPHESTEHRRSGLPGHPGRTGRHHHLA